MTNQEISDLFTTKIPENAPKDFYDRYLDLAIFINDTSPVEQDSEAVINGLATSLEEAYTLERI